MSFEPVERSSGEGGRPEGERRGARRLPADRAVYFAGKDTLLQPGQVTEISRGGMRIDATLPLPIGAEIEIELLPKDQNQGTPLVMRGRVVHHEASVRGTGMGVRVWGGADRLNGVDATAWSSAEAQAPSWAEATPSAHVVTTPSMAPKRSRHIRSLFLSVAALWSLVAALLLWQSFASWPLLRLAKSPSAPKIAPASSEREAARRAPVSEIPPGVKRRVDQTEDASRATVDDSPSEANRQGSASARSGDSTSGEGGSPAAPLHVNLVSVRPFGELPHGDATAEIGHGMGGPANDLDQVSLQNANAHIAASLAPPAAGQSQEEPSTESNGLASQAIAILAPPFSVDLVRGPGKNTPDADAIRLLVDKSDHALVLYRGGRPLRVFPVGLGRNDSTPEGLFHIANKLTNPDWYTNGKVIPGGSPLNRIGKRWMGLANEAGRTSYGIHPAKNPNTVGQDASLGCIQMTADDAETLFRFCPVGTEVVIQP